MKMQTLGRFICMVTVLSMGCRRASPTFMPGEGDGAVVGDGSAPGAAANCVGPNCVNDGGVGDGGASKGDGSTSDGGGACTDGCFVLGATECQGGMIRACVKDDGGCLNWTAP